MSGYLKEPPPPKKTWYFVLGILFLAGEQNQWWNLCVYVCVYMYVYVYMYPAPT